MNFFQPSMAEPLFASTVFLASLSVGVLGTLVGLGGGALLVPVLTLLFGVPIQLAAGASIVSVIATSAGGAVNFLRDRITNIRLGLVLEVATTLGAITGGLIVGFVAPRWLFVCFALLLAYSATAMWRMRRVELPVGVREHPLARRLRLAGEYEDAALGLKVSYQVAGVPLGFFIMYLAGVFSGLLGIGSGLFNVLGMDQAMRLPMKVSAATSNFMIGVTAATSAGIYFARGAVHPALAAPVALGVLAGAAVGTRLMNRLPSRVIRAIFVPILLYTAASMVWRAVSMA